MKTVDLFPGGYHPDHNPPVRGDKITADRYFSKDWMKKEWDHLWTKIWHVGGHISDIEEAGDWVRHNMMAESVIMVRQKDGSIKAFYNACQHRGNRLVFEDIGGGEAITCSYHGWKWGNDGVLEQVQNPEDVIGGNPCGKLKLVELKCEVWAGFIWYNMDPEAQQLLEWLDPLPELLAGYQMETQTRTLYLTTEVPCNWKVIRDNFNESYHLPTLHPELATFVEDDYKNTHFQSYKSGHNVMVMKGHQPSTREIPQEFCEPPLDDVLDYWGLDAKAFEKRPADARLAIQKAKREKGGERGFTFFETLNDTQLTDYYHCTFWPNFSLTLSSDGFQVLRSEPHPTDPEKCIFDHWFFNPEVEGRDVVETPIGPLPFEDAEHETIIYGEKSLGYVADQDLSVGSGQQKGLHSRGYTGGVLTGQEKRIQRFHELLNDAVGVGPT